ncbi:PREDICTED: proline-rich protein 32 [Myotis brandtii]|nr:PREDICTED: proline-rich protein 32 [Myotis brandtii]
MACVENVLEGHASSSIAMTVDENVKPRPDPNKFLQCSSTMLKEEAESWGKPRRPLRPPLYVPPELTRGQLEGPRERRGSCIPVDTLRALQCPYWPPPAAAKGSLATAEVNSSVGLAGWGQMGQDSINVSQKFPGCSPSVMISNEGAEGGVNKAKFHSVLQQGQGFFPPRGPLIKDPPPIPTVGSGIKMEEPPVNVKMAGNEKMPQAAFPLGGPWNPMYNCPRPIIMPASVAHVGWLTNGPCFIPSGPPSSYPFLNLPFPPPPMYRPPLLPYFGNFPSSELPPP